MKAIDLIGSRFGRLLVIGREPNASWGAARWRCRCECGNKTITIGRDLRTGHTVSCGCWNADRFSDVGKANRTHGHTAEGKTSSAYTIWSGMKERCLSASSPAFPRYGGRGIKICDRWHDFANFLADMGEPTKGRTLDRIDVNGDYEPHNCRWASWKEQNRNKRNNRLVTFGGKKMTVAEFAETTGISYELATWRLKRGWPPEKAATPPRPWIRKQP